MDENIEVNKLEDTTEITSSNKTSSNPNQIAGAIVLAGIIIAGAILLKGSAGPTPSGIAKDNTSPTELLARPISSEDHIVGNRNSKTIILEYSDLDCPYCRNFHSTMKQVSASNEDVAWVYRHYPIPQLHPDAPKKAEATECAWEQGGNEAFWAYADKLFETKYSLAELSTVAQSIGLNAVAFDACLSSGKYAAKVQADIEDGQKMSVSGTPSSFILVKGKIADTIPGAQKYETIIEKLKAL